MGVSLTEAAVAGSAGIEPSASHAAKIAMTKMCRPQSVDGREFGTAAPVASYTRFSVTLDSSYCSNTWGPSCGLTLTTNCLPLQPADWSATPFSDDTTLCAPGV